MYQITFDFVKLDVFNNHYLAKLALITDCLDRKRTSISKSYQALRITLWDLAACESRPSTLVSTIVHEPSPPSASRDSYS